MRLWLAIRAFFAVLGDARKSSEVERVLGEEAPGPEKPEPQKPAPRAAKIPKPSPRSDAVTLLATLQREARLVDIVKEPLGAYSNEQIGAAARDVLRDCAAVLDRLFGLKPVVEAQEGAVVETPPVVDVGRYHVVGNVSGDPPFRGRLIHHGWEATRCNLPTWTGADESALVVAPVELEAT